jgi:superfamily I DNA/RNA helicase
MEPLLVGLTELRAQGDTRIRQHAIRRIERVLLSFFEWPDQGGALTRSDQLDMLQVGSDQLRILVSRLLTESGTWADKKDCSSTVRALVEGFATTTPVNLRDRIGTRCQVTDTVWAYWQSHAEPELVAASIETIRWGHIHGVKGAEFDAVVVALPPRARQGHHVLDDWQTDVNSEQRRVLYVGASRARKVLVLVTPKPRSAQLLEILEGANIPHTVSEAT